MSIETWKAEFMPVSANDPLVQINGVEAARHSWWKWYGMLPKNLAKHHVKLDQFNSEVSGSDGRGVYVMGSSNCALCVRYRDNSGFTDCTICPLAIVRGGVECFCATETEVISPYEAATEGSPKELVWWLEKAFQEAKLSVRQGGAK